MFSTNTTALKSQRRATYKLFMWLLMVLTLFVLGLQPLMIGRNNLVQGLSGKNSYYANAPLVVVGGSVNDDTHTVNDGTNSLFANDNVDATVLKELLQYINDESIWKDDLNQDIAIPKGDEVVYLTAENFSKYNANDNARVVVKLFDTTNLEQDDYSINSFTDSLWQAVYRTTSANQDILTLYMTAPFANYSFSTNRGEYSNSLVRTFINNVYTELTANISGFDNYIITPSELPNEWQSASNQTSKNAVNAYWAAGTKGGVGASGSGAGEQIYALGNGMDGQSDGWANWGTPTSAYQDKIWLPSAFEVLHTGYGENETSTTISGALYDRGTPVTYLTDYDDVNTTINGASNNNGRTGLWELNAFDRAFDTSEVSYSWLRSGRSDDYFSATHIGQDDTLDYYNSSYAYGVRVALHLDIRKLAEDYNLINQITAEVASGSIVTPSISINGDSVTNVQVYTSSNASVGTGKIIYNVDTTNYRADTVSINGNNIQIKGTNGAGSIQNVADYEYYESDDGFYVIVNNIKQNVNVVTNFVDKLYNDIEFNITGNGSLNILLCIAQENGSGGYDIMYQYFIDEPQILSVTLVSQQNYKIYFIKRYGDKVNMQDGEMNVYNLTLTEDITIRAEVTAFPPINNSIIV